MRRGSIPTADPHEGPVEITCQICRTVKTISATKRNDARFSGFYCDGAFGSRHPASMMVGPEGEKNR